MRKQTLITTQRLNYNNFYNKKTKTTNHIKIAITSLIRCQFGSLLLLRMCFVAVLPYIIGLLLKRLVLQIGKEILSEFLKFLS